MELSPPALDNQRDRILRLYGDVLPPETIAHMENCFIFRDRIIEGAEILYAVRSELTEPWADYLRNLLSFIIQLSWAMENDPDRTRAFLMLMEVNNPGENPPEPLARYLPVESE